MRVTSYRHRSEDPGKKKKDEATLKAPQKRVVRCHGHPCEVESQDYLHYPKNNREQQTSSISLNVNPAWSYWHGDQPVQFPWLSIAPVLAQG
jgi:hypothetical protein